MPIILRQGPYKLFFYSNEGSPREPAHIHVRAGSKEAKFWLEPDVALADNNGFHAKELKSIIGIVSAARQQIVDAWNVYFGN
ncbi:DUF4160 domain-containing protein [Mesorhizobium sp. L-8-3]|uniref:DUF4160 domain-containing protein n=1 Tax=Mesorhizobium sp. L-8-3 TaxID=2744522 RepID=UPI0019275C53|nr:DUF4160 domain-containing protein [Mesorhizobium sp. L-8-3]BCH24432.1 hypothetical protein MesoLjLb_42170 [Mesorhizobium sp. L-8-3]